MLTFLFNSWDDWVDSDRIRKLTEENKELARTLQREYVESTRKVTSATKTHGKRKGAPDDSSHASEERQNSLPASGRGKRQREDLEKVCPLSLVSRCYEFVS